MSWLGGLSRRGRQLLIAAAVCGALLILVVGVFAPAKESSPVPSTYSSGTHGARAAYLLLRRAGYPVVQSTTPLGKLAGKTTPETTYIFADPFPGQIQDARKQVKEILSRGGRVLATGMTGALLLGKHKYLMGTSFELPCTAKPEGLSGIAASGPVRMVEEAAWQRPGAGQRVVYRCGYDPVVVTYSVGKGTVVWWASASPLENGTIEQAGNLNLLLNSIGPRATTHVIWDETLHGASPSLLSWTKGTVLPYVWWQFGLAALLLIFSFSRRSGALRPDPVVRRAAPLEFAQSLGSLYEKARAANVAVTVAYQNFRLRLEKKAGIAMQATAEQAAETVLRRYPRNPEIARVIQAAARVSDESRLSEHDALKLVQALQDAERVII